MADLHTLTPLGGRQSVVHSFDGLTISEDESRSLASLAMRRGKEEQFARAAQRIFGFAMPKPARFTTGDTYSALWTAPEQWFVEAPQESHEDLAAILKKAFKTSASVTEQSGGWARFVLEGQNLVPVLERLAMIDVAKMRAGDAARTIIEHQGVIMLCHKGAKRLSLLAPRSSAASFHHALVTAAASAI